MSLADWIIWLANIVLGLDDRRKYVHPGPKQAAQVKKIHAVKQKPDWETTQRNLGMIDIEVEEGVIESVFAHKITTERTPRLTDEERVMIRDANLDEAKASRVKVFWAQNKSTQTTADEIGERGYGSRTLDNYWKIFNHSLSGEG